MHAFRLPQRPGLQDRRRTAGFTLLELMVAVSVLAILCGLVMQLMGSATRVTGNARQAADCDAQARFALSQIARDISHRIRRPDVDAYVEKNSGNDRFYLFSETPGYNPALTNPLDKSPTSLVGYRLTQKNSQVLGTLMHLERCAIGLPWSAGTGSIRPLPFVALDPFRKPVPSTTLAGGDGRGQGGTFEDLLAQRNEFQSYYQEVASNVIRFEVSLLLKPGLDVEKTEQSRFPTAEELSKNPARLLGNGEVNTELARYGFTRISAVVVSLAIVDSRSVTQVSLDELLKAANALPDTQPNLYPVLPMDQWNQTFQTMSAGWPRPLTAGIRFYQRAIPLH